MIEIINLLLPAASILAGTAMSWGYLQSKVSALEAEQKENKRKDEERDKEIKALRDRGLQLVFRDECDKDRAECKDSICGHFESIEEMIAQNKREVVAKFDVITEFMGYVKRAMEEQKNALR